VAGPFPPSPDAAASAALQTVKDLLHEGHAVEAMSPLPSAADHHGPLAGLKGAIGLARRARGFDALHLQVGRGLLFRPEQPQARRVLDSALLALSLRLWRRTIADVGDRFEGDILGADPQAAWKEAAAVALAAASPEALGRTVHLSYGDVPAQEYLGQLTADHVIHAWDLARGIGADERLDPELVQFVHTAVAPQIEPARSAGMFGPAVEVPAGADLQAKLLALTGRTP